MEDCRVSSLISLVSEEGKIISTLQSEDGVAVTHEDKHQIIYNHFMLHTGTYLPRACSLNVTSRKF
jgi:hypothetical protein